MTGTLGRNLLIHTGRGDEYIRDGVLGDALIHEATHTSMDGPHLKSEGWQAAMVSDGIAISRYAADYPTVTQITNILDPYSTGFSAYSDWQRWDGKKSVTVRGESFLLCHCIQTFFIV